MGDNLARSAFLDLPYEVRQMILEIALFRSQPCQLQTPMWGQPQDCLDPMFEVCRSLRDEALEAFYKVNNFRWKIDIPEHACTHMATSYPLYREDEADVPLAPAFPWKYPLLFKHLRRLQLRVWLPREYDDGLKLGRLRDGVNAIVQAVDYGRRLQRLSIILVVPKYGWGSRRSMESHKIVLEPLRQMEVPGRVRAVPFPLTTARKTQSIFDLANLPQCMKAESA